MIVGHAVLENYPALWELAEASQALLGDVGQLLAMGEDAVDSHLGLWLTFPRQSWQRGRIFGQSGELQWRSFGKLVRVVLLLDEELITAAEAASESKSAGIAAQLKGLGVETTVTTDYQPEEEQIFLWRGGYQSTQIRRYVDEQGIAAFVRYASATLETATTN